MHNEKGWLLYWSTC